MREAKRRFNEAVFAVGTAAWLVALVVLAAVGAVSGADVREWLWICGTGLGLGLIGIGYARRSWRAR
ncbi:MAG: DUF2530 domain-containing protein [Bifidobacteriaceae bacterium]|nr:DUF2530 domain-containing protein [Bifidobacteriaceae bacterium]